jgi:hypothetical protein
VRFVPVLALLPSPLLGTAVWAPVASLLRGLGWRVAVAGLSGPAPANARTALNGYLDALPHDGELILVPHSNAGLYVPAITEHRNVAAVVFVDAGIPPLHGGDVPTLPSEFYGMVAAKADEHGLLPVWTQWWEEQDMHQLFPDPAIRAAIERDQRRLPLSYFEDTVTVMEGWADRPCAYLAFGEGYATEEATARRAGWAVRVLDGEHLEMTVHPQSVADGILALLAEATGAGHLKRM